MPGCAGVSGVSDGQDGCTQDGIQHHRRVPQKLSEKPAAETGTAAQAKTTSAVRSVMIFLFIGITSLLFVLRQRLADCKL